MFFLDIVFNEHYNNIQFALNIEMIFIAAVAVCVLVALCTMHECVSVSTRIRCLLFIQWKIHGYQNQKLIRVVFDKMCVHGELYERGTIESVKL